jgi:hypothetical protein
MGYPGRGCCHLSELATEAGPSGGVEESRREEVKERGEMNSLTLQEAWEHFGAQAWLSDEMRVLICQTIVKLPPAVQDFALFECVYLEFSDDLRGCCFPSHICEGKRWIIQIRKEHADEYVIAHELAHAKFGHTPNCGNLLAEEDADRQAKAWGFTVPRDRKKVHQEYRAAAARRALERAGAKPRRKGRGSDG